LSCEKATAEENKQQSNKNNLLMEAGVCPDLFLIIAMGLMNNSSDYKKTVITKYRIFSAKSFQ